MTNPYRAMCAELITAVDDATESVDRTSDCVNAANYPELWAECMELIRKHDGLLTRARALLDQPEPEGPTDEEIMELMPQQMRDDLAAAASALAVIDHADIEAAGFIRVILNRHAVDHARAALAKYGSTTPQLVAEGATDDKLMDIARATDLVYYMGEDCGFASPYMEGTDITAEVLAYARAVLAKWGHQ